MKVNDIQVIKSPGKLLITTFIKLIPKNENKINGRTLFYIQTQAQGQLVDLV